MFGYKKLKIQVETLTAAVAQLCEIVEKNTSEVKALKKFNDGQFSSLDKKLLEIKLDISKTSAKFHSTDEKVARVAIQNDNFDKFFQNQIKTNNAIEPMLTLYGSFPDQIQDFIRKQENIFQYIQNIEKLIVNTEAIIENCLPIKAVPKLPKKTKATIEAS